PEQPQRLGHRTARIFGARALGVLGVGDSEQQDSPDAKLGKAISFAHREVWRDPVMPFQRGDLVAPVVSADHEKRSDQLGPVEPGLADERAHCGIRPETSRTLSSRKRDLWPNN